MRRVTVLLVAAVMLAAGCSSGTTDTTTTAAEASTTTIMSTVTTTAVDQGTTTTSVSDDEVTITRDIVYFQEDGNDVLVDVYAPVGEGPWPVVVAFHGGGVYKSDSYLTVVAEAAAAAGMVVFAPNWVAEWPSPLTPGVEEMASWEAMYRCAFAFAQREAPGYGGDPDRAVVYGFSAGVGPASHLALDPATDLASGCLAEAPSGPPVGAVLGDGGYFFHSTLWDAGFDADPEGMAAIAAEVVDPASWPADMSTRFRLWVAAGGTLARQFDDPWEEEGWLAQRDPDGTIREDLNELGELDDGVISFIDEGLLLAYRLESVGADVTIDEFPGGHDVFGKVPELVAYLLDAAGTS